MSGTVTSAPRPRRTPLGVQRLLWFIERYALVVLFAAVMLFFATLGRTSATFLTSANVSLTLGDQAVTLLVALALLPAIIAGYFDLSVGAMTGVNAIVTAAVMSKAHLAPGVAILAGMGFGTLMGCVTGVLVVGLGLNSFIATLGFASVLAGLVQLYTNGLPIQSDIPNGFSNFGSSEWLSIPKPVYVVAGVVLITWYLLGHTPIGRHLYSIGSNPNAARLVGIRVRGVVFGSFVWSGLICGIAGALLASRTAGANPQVGPDFLFPAFAAVFLGASAIQPGKFNVIGTVIGLYFLAFTVSGITLAGAQPWVQPFFNGVALLIAVAISTLVRRHRARTT